MVASSLVWLVAQEKIYLEDIRDTISSQYLIEYLQEGQETGTLRSGRRLSGRVGEEVKRLEGGEGGIVGGKGGWKEKEGERMMCKSRKEGVKEGGDRIVRRVGRVSKVAKTLEQGARQKNKISSYISKFGGGTGMEREGGHPLAVEILCVGVKREFEYCVNESENECVGSASKRSRGDHINSL